MKSKFIYILLTVLALCFSVNINGQNFPGKESPVVQKGNSKPQTAHITNDLDFMIFLHRFTSDPDFQMAHIKFPLGEMSYAYLEDQGRYDSFTSKYWVLQSMESLQGHFKWEGDSKIVYLYNSSMYSAEIGFDEVPEFENTYTFEKIDGEWYVTKGNYSGSDVGLAQYTAEDALKKNAQFRHKYNQSIPLYVYTGTPGDYPKASERLLMEKDLEGLTKKELRIMRNEILARHGYSFKSEDLKNRFESQPWYFPLSNDVSKQLSIIEKANIKFIQKHEK